MSIDVKICEISFGYKDIKILDHISFYIPARAFVSIIGPNGSGKSTLLKNISSLLKPESGNIKIGEIDIHKISSKEIAKIIAVVPQETNIEFRFTTEDIVSMGRSPHISRFQSESIKDYKIVREAMELTHTYHLKDRVINELSGGERQRVIIARALAQEPKIILLDEPTSYLDIRHQIEILQLLKKLNQQDGMTVVAVLHDINLAARFSTHMVLLKDGKIIESGSPDQVITIKNLKDAYEMDMVVQKSPYTNTPYVIPL
ncbi:heme ABC transporter ATP-binding protein [Anaerophilus nitritogenes]|uniref:heme ABC transporter ATP-binding protein n=1 Tax=Anaerophilus nitritogenes TaxID=2498136 RepID=UPI00101B9E96|nr:heme ABC transporter ATP-binding protein [Anaerophilus nitritogenes]